MAIARRSWLRVVTFNTWFDDFAQESRRQALFEILRGSNADFICLQEVTPQWFKPLMALGWVRDAYRIPLAADRTLRPYGELILAKREWAPRFELHPLPSRMGRSLLTATCTVRGHTVVVGTVHLESLANPELRRMQLEVCAVVFARAGGDSILAGDFNFCSDRNYSGEGLLENGVLAEVLPDHVDLWPSLRPADPGYTFDCRANTMLGSPRRDEQMRYDRILARASRLRPTRIELLGTQRISKSEVFPSDHFGLLAELAVEEEE